MTAIRVVWLGAAALVWAEGILDGAVAAELHEAMDALVDEEPESVVLDMSGVQAVDDGGVAVLAAAAARLSHAGVVLELRLPDQRALTVADAGTLRDVLTAAYPPVGPADET
jgi:anti-anti-sigma factor